MLGLGAERSRSVIAESHLRDDRQIRRELAQGTDGESELPQIRERFENHEIDSARDQSLALFAKARAHLLCGNRSDRRDRFSERTDGPGNENRTVFVPDSASRDRRAGLVDLTDAVFEPVRLELETVGAISVRLEDVDTDAEVITMHRPHELAIREVELVETAVDHHALAVERGAHGAVTNERRG